MGNTLTRRQVLAAAPAASLAPRGQRAPAPPNVVLILADDLGYADIGPYGQKLIATPNLDRLAEAGLRFRQAYGGSTVCAPSRCCLMTGRHTGHATIRGNEEPHVPLLRDELTLAELFQRAGYRTGAFGKWGLGTPPDTHALPTRKGFDEFFGYYHQIHAHSYFPHMLWDNERESYLTPNFDGKKIYAHDRILERALQFIDANHATPFFLYAPFTIPHGRFEAPDEKPYENAGWPDVFRTIASMIHRLDASVGAILERLERYGLERRTLVIFTSDNGPGRLAASRFQSSGPLRGVKRDLYEGGIRVPLLARWTGVTRLGVSDHVCAAWDFLPTFAELLGAPQPARIDGISFLPELLGAPSRQRRHEYLYWEFFERGFQQAVRAGGWKAVRRKPGVPIELYDLARDVGETRDVAGANPSVVNRIEEILRTCRTPDPRWG